MQYTKGQLIQALQQIQGDDDTLVLVRGGQLDTLTEDIASVELDETPDINAEEDDAPMVPCVFLNLEG